jgi:hypothetical protein
MDYDHERYFAQQVSKMIPGLMGSEEGWSEIHSIDCETMASSNYDEFRP